MSTNKSNVQIVSHTFCDYLGSIKRRTSTASSSYASLSKHKNEDASNCQKNKVRVYVPYSTLIALTNEIRETPVDDMDDIDYEIQEDPSESTENENVVICDTQVILRINPDQSCSETDSKKEGSDLKLHQGNNKRMTKRLLTSSEVFKEKTQHQKTQQLPKLPKRKDLCKLLGLNEQDVDLCIVPEVKVAQKVALSHSSELSLNHAETVKNTAKKKDLAKFLGVEEDQTPQAIQDSSPIEPSYRVRKNDPSPSSALNFIKMVKSSVMVKPWKSDNPHNSDMEMDVPVQLRQVPAKEPTERTHRKDLSKFLGFDDSDSEEIVFIRNANPSNDSSSLTRKSLIINNTESTSASNAETNTENEDAESDDDSVGSLRSFDSFVRRSLRCGASSEFAIQIEEGASAQHKTQQQSLVTLDRKTSRNNVQQGTKHKVAFGPNSRRMISPIRSRRRRQISAAEQQMPPVFLREEPLLVYPQKPALFYQHYPMYASYGILSGPPPPPPQQVNGGPRINPSNGRVRFPRQQAKRPQMNG